jgi:alkylation response protein AidB-like acyl-CoA dehydrogenase
LHGTKPVVLDGHTADFAIVAAQTPDGLAAFALDEPRAQPVPALDVTRKVARLVLDGQAGAAHRTPGDQTAVLARVGDDIAVALCAETVGAADRALNMAIEYSKQRVQFDRPIATFQAIKHKIVDMLHQLELARVGTHWAAWTSQVDDPLRQPAAAACKAFVAEAATMVTAENIQVHGGVGFTWDLDCHLLFRRVKQNDVLFGSPGVEPPAPGRPGPRPRLSWFRTSQRKWRSSSLAYRVPRVAVLGSSTPTRGRCRWPGRRSRPGPRPWTGTRRA